MGSKKTQSGIGNDSDTPASPDSLVSSDIPEVEVDGADIVSSEGTPETGQHLVISVGNNLKNNRLDKYLQSRFSQFSRTHLQKLIKAQGVNVNNHPAKPSHKLNAGDKVDLVLPAKQVRELLPEDIPLDIIFEDDEIIVVNKQSDLIVHPARGYKTGTLVNALVFHANKLSSINGDFRPGIVHRLDRNTTGVMIVAKTDTSHWMLSRQFAERTTQKTYLAVVHGVPQLSADRINEPIGTKPHQREKMAVRQDGKESVTFYKVLEEFRGYSLIELSPKTGRTHQIRVHMRYIKHPIVADDMYGGKVVYPWQIEDREAEPEDPLMNRVALHAWRLEINHPVSKERLTFEADPPEDILNLIENLRKFRPIIPESNKPSRVKPKTE